MIKAVIIDDESPSIVTLRWKLENYCPNVEVVASFEDPREGLEFLRKSPPDLLFLDIEMPMLNGFDVLEELGRDVPFSIIFTTAYENFGIRAIKFSALDYLLKPVHNKELVEAVEKHLQKNNQSETQQRIGLLLDNVNAEKKGSSGKIALATKESIEFVDPAEIIVCSSDSNYTMVYLVDGRKQLISKTLKDFEEMLLPLNFYRPHNSHLINLNLVHKYMRERGGYLIMKNQMKIPVSKGRREGLLEKLF